MKYQFKGLSFDTKDAFIAHVKSIQSTLVATDFHAGTQSLSRFKNATNSGGDIATAITAEELIGDGADFILDESEILASARKYVKSHKELSDADALVKDLRQKFSEGFYFGIKVSLDAFPMILEGARMTNRTVANGGRRIMLAFRTAFNDTPTSDNFNTNLFAEFKNSGTFRQFQLETVKSSDGKKEYVLPKMHDGEDGKGGKPVAHLVSVAISPTRKDKTYYRTSDPAYVEEARKQGGLIVNVDGEDMCYIYHTADNDFRVERFVDVLPDRATFDTLRQAFTKSFNAEVESTVQQNIVKKSSAVDQEKAKAQIAVDTVKAQGEIEVETAKKMAKIKALQGFLDAKMIDESTFESEKLKILFS